MMQGFLEQLALRELRLLFVGLGAVFITGLTVALIIPNLKEIRAAGHAIKMLQETTQDGAKLEQLLQQKHAQLKKLRLQLHGDTANLPAKQVEAYVIGRLQRVSWSNDIELVSVEPTTGDRIQVFQEILFNVRLVGQYEDLYHWLWEAREDLGYIVVKKFSVSRQDNADEQPKLVANLSLASYRAVE